MLQGRPRAPSRPDRRLDIPGNCRLELQNGMARRREGMQATVPYNKGTRSREVVERAGQVWWRAGTCIGGGAERKQGEGKGAEGWRVNVGVLQARVESRRGRWAAENNSSFGGWEGGRQCRSRYGQQDRCGSRNAVGVGGGAVGRED